MRNRTKTKIIAFCLILGLIIASNPVLVIAQEEEGPTGKDPDIQDIAQELKDQRESIEKLQEKVAAYEKKIQGKRSEALNTKNQLGAFNDEIDQTRLEIEIKRKEITEINLKTIETKHKIQVKDEEISGQKERIAEFIRLLYQNNQKSYVEILLANDAFSEFFDQNHYLQTIEEDIEVVLKKLKAVQEKLEFEKLELDEQHETLEELREKLTGTQVGLEEKITAKNVILEATQADEAKFQKLLKQVRAEQAQINADIISLERDLRARLEAKGDKTLSELSGQGFIWPVPSKLITSRFHDPDYPFRRYFEHPAIDIRSKQGTPIKAVGSGYVSRTRDGGLGYSYISVIHADGLSSVYGHVSCITVQEDEYVVQGQVIGCSGATPGTPGAGRLTTGPHLHLEIRLNGIPVNPVGYFP